MKRFHVHVHVDDLAASLAFYSKLFGAEPARVEADYAKWMLEDPRVNFAISTRGSRPGVDHLGFQTDSAEELAELKARAQSAEMAMLDEGETTCCYARSEKHWITDPQGIAWEQFHTLDGIPVFSEEAAQAPSQRTSQDSACCAPAASSPAEAASGAACCAPIARGKPVGVAVRSAGSCC